MVSIYQSKNSQPWILKSAKIEMQIIEFVQANPGCSSNAIRYYIQDRFDASTYHLRNLMVSLTKAEVIRYDYSKRGYFLT